MDDATEGVVAAVAVAGGNGELAFVGWDAGPKKEGCGSGVTMPEGKWS